MVTFEDPGKKRGSIAQDDALRSMRKAFMSHKASKVLDEQNDQVSARQAHFSGLPRPSATVYAHLREHTSSLALRCQGCVPLRVQGASNGGAAEEEDLGGMSKEEFEKIMWEVERFGATAFDKKELKSWKSQVITRLGGRAERGPRMDVKIGGGIAKVRPKGRIGGAFLWRCRGGIACSIVQWHEADGGREPRAQKRKERERKELELAFETGMKTRKGSGKHAKRERDRERDRGLQELSGWRDGTLRLSKRDFDKATQGGPPQGKLSFGSLGLGAKGGMKKGKAPGRGKGGKGGKGGKSSKRR